MFRIGDLVKLKQPENHINTRPFNKDQNLYRISQIDQKKVHLSDISNELDISEIEPIPINGVDDKNIYYDPVIAAATTLPNSPSPIYSSDHSYYLDHFKNCCCGSKNLAEIISEANLKYVHEIQHFLQERYHKDELKIKV